jgi:hypothetical protein
MCFAITVQIKTSLPVHEKRLFSSKQLTFVTDSCVAKFALAKAKAPGWPDEFVKKSPTMQPSPCLSKLIRNFFSVKKWFKVWVASQIFKNLPEVNKRPMRKNSPNLVTLWGAPLSRHAADSFGTVERNLDMHLVCINIPILTCIPTYMYTHQRFTKTSTDTKCFPIKISIFNRFQPIFFA